MRADHYWIANNQQSCTFMKLVIDLQAAQSASRHTEIGRYSLGLAEAMARQAGSHEVWIAFNSAFPDQIHNLRSAFDTLVSRERIVVWEAPDLVVENGETDLWRQRSSEILREAFLASLKPDVVHVPNLFEGLDASAIASVGSHIEGDRTAVTLSALPSLINPDDQSVDLKTKAFCHRQITSLRRAGLWLAGSESCRVEAINGLDLPSDKVFNVSVAASSLFRPKDLLEGESEVLQRYGLNRKFVMATGGLDLPSNLLPMLRAYSSLSAELRSDHQLLVLCPRLGEVEDVKHSAQQYGIRDEELAILPIVSAEELVILYNNCEVFCQSHLHSDFGLSALEAMQCGAPTIGSNSSSLAEIIAWKHALFDPRSDEEIAAKLHQVLTDADYRQALRSMGQDRAREFSWDSCARRAWDAFESHQEQIRETAGSKSSAMVRGRHTLAYLSPLPPERSGISDYSAELLPELARHYDVEVVVDQTEISDEWVKANCPVRDVNWFRRNGQRYDRILYHVGNSPFHKHMFDLLELHPGVVMLHDFFLSNVIAHLELHSGWTGFWKKALYQSHGYSALREREYNTNVADVIYRYPANYHVLQNAQGVIVHSDHSRDLARQFYGKNASDDWMVVPFLKRVGPTADRDTIRKRLGFRDDDFVLCSFGIMNPTKLNHRLVRAWLDSRLAADPNCHLVFVGQEDEGEYGMKIRQWINESPARGRIHITGFTPLHLYRSYLQAADAAVQLRTHSRGETSAAVFDCMAYGLPTIVNAHGSMAELPEADVVMLPDNFEDMRLVAAMWRLRADMLDRQSLGARAREHVKNHMAPRSVADRYHEAIERFATQSKKGLERQALSTLVSLEPQPQNEHEWVDLARAMNRNLSVPRPQGQLLVDVSANVVTDLKSGIERVVRAQVLELLKSPPQGFRVEPVYLVNEAKRSYYRYARKYTARLLSLDVNALEDEPVDIALGDIFYSPDYYPDGVTRAAANGLYADWRARGVDVTVLVYDLLPTLRPEFFPEFASEPHTRWLEAVAANADRLICISQAVADELSEWLKTRIRPRYACSPEITALHLGADISATGSSFGMPDDADSVLKRIETAASFLMVGTIEPRKGHLQTIAAFEELWREGLDVNLVIVGAEGWRPVPQEQRRTIPDIVKRLRNHPELGKRLHWLEGISDEYLEKLYSASACLIAASEGEGFGLPLIEAARQGIPIVARDIPVFREVAGEHASYFSGAAPRDLANAVKDWLKLHAEDRHARSDNMPWLTWAQCAQRLKDILLHRDGAGVLDLEQKSVSTHEVLDRVGDLH
jgi:glycosyltransferase involved in cell wall biosynthesis